MENKQQIVADHIAELENNYPVGIAHIKGVTVGEVTQILHKLNYTWFNRGYAESKYNPVNPNVPTILPDARKLDLFSRPENVTDAFLAFIPRNDAETIASLVHKEMVRNITKLIEGKAEQWETTYTGLPAISAYLESIGFEAVSEIFDGYCIFVRDNKSHTGYTVRSISIRIHNPNKEGITEVHVFHSNY